MIGNTTHPTWRMKPGFLVVVLLGACGSPRAAFPTGQPVEVSTLCTPVDVPIEAPGNARLELSLMGAPDGMRVRSCGAHVCGGALPVSPQVSLPELWREPVETLRFEPMFGCRAARIRLEYHWLIID